LRWPAEPVARWLTTVPLVGDAIDIGCGSGRHVRLLQDHTMSVRCCDISSDALNWTALATGVRGDVCDMTTLPYPDSSFDTAIAYGVFYYGTRRQHQKAVDELRRVLRPGGNAFIAERSSRDWRSRHINQSGVFRLPDHPEDGMKMDLLDHASLSALYRKFTKGNVEVTATTEATMTRPNLHWLVSVTK
jgi:ubiquinone/menaquinone biosynthesis C-methylase UbiE